MIKILETGAPTFVGVFIGNIIGFAIGFVLVWFVLPALSRWLRRLACKVRGVFS